MSSSLHCDVPAFHFCNTPHNDKGGEYYPRALWQKHRKKLKKTHKGFDDLSFKLGDLPNWKNKKVLPSCFVPKSWKINRTIWMIKITADTALRDEDKTYRCDNSYGCMAQNQNINFSFAESAFNDEDEQDDDQSRPPFQLNDSQLTEIPPTSLNLLNNSLSNISLSAKSQLKYLLIPISLK